MPLDSLHKGLTNIRQREYIERMKGRVGNRASVITFLELRGQNREKGSRAKTDCKTEKGTGCINDMVTSLLER